VRDDDVGARRRVPGYFAAGRVRRAADVGFADTVRFTFRVAVTFRVAAGVPF
jgi:hypothetical protein